MPSWIETPAEEKAWSKAKAVVSRQRKKNETSFTNRDWGLVTHVAKSILRSASISGSALPNEEVLYALAKVSSIIDQRHKKGRKAVDETLPAREMVSGLSRLADVTSKVIAAYRDKNVTSQDKEVLRRVRDATSAIESLLNSGDE